MFGVWECSRGEFYQRSRPKNYSASDPPQDHLFPARMRRIDSDRANPQPESNREGERSPMARASAIDKARAEPSPLVE